MHNIKTINITLWGVSGQVLPHVSVWPDVWDCCATCIYCNILQSGTCISSRAPAACCAPDPFFCTHLPGSGSCLELAAVNRNNTRFNMFHVACTDRMCNVLLEQTNSVGLINVILLYSNHRHVSATHVTIFRVLSARKQIYMYVHIYSYGEDVRAPKLWSSQNL